MTPAEIRAAYVAAIGEDCTAALEAASLLPVDAEENMNPISNVRTDYRIDASWRLQRRYRTAWVDVPEPAES